MSYASDRGRGPRPLRDSMVLTVVAMGVGLGSLRTSGTELPSVSENETPSASRLPGASTHSDIALGSSSMAYALQGAAFDVVRAVEAQPRAATPLPEMPQAQQPALQQAHSAFDESFAEFRELAVPAAGITPDLDPVPAGTLGELPAAIAASQRGVTDDIAPGPVPAVAEADIGSLGNELAQAEIGLSLQPPETEVASAIVDGNPDAPFVDQAQLAKAESHRAPRIASQIADTGPIALAAVITPYQFEAFAPLLTEDGIVRLGATETKLASDPGTPPAAASEVGRPMNAVLAQVAAAGQIAVPSQAVPDRYSAVVAPPPIQTGAGSWFAGLPNVDGWTLAGQGDPAASTIQAAPRRQTAAAEPKLANGKFRVTGRGIEFALPAVINGETKSIPLLIDPDQNVSIRLLDLLGLVQTLLPESEYSSLARAEAVREYVSLRQLRDRGLDFHYDAARNRLILDVT